MNLSLHFLILSPFPLHFLILSPFPRSPAARLPQFVQSDVVFENGDFGSCICGGDHCEDYTFMLYYICLGWGHDYNIGS